MLSFFFAPEGMISANALASVIDSHYISKYTLYNVARETSNGANCQISTSVKK